MDTPITALFTLANPNAVGDERVREGLETDDESNSRILKKEGRTNRKKETFPILPLQAPAPTGAFYFFNNSQSTENDPNTWLP